MTTTGKMSVDQKLSTARMMIRERLPYLRAALFGALYRPVVGLGTYATSNWVIMYDPIVVDRETVENAAASLLHELLHNIRNHSERCKALCAEHRIWNIAADAEINDDITGMKFQLPDFCVWAKNFGMEDGNIAEAYYAKLRQDADAAKKLMKEISAKIKAHQKAQKGKGAKGGDPGEGEGEDGEGEGEGEGDSPQVGAGWCGSGAGHAHPKEPKDGDGQEKGQAPPSGPSGKAPGKGQGGAGSDPADQGGAGDGWGDGRTEAEGVRIRKDVAAAAMKHAATKGRGSVPGGFLAWAESEIKPAKVDWRAKLAKVLKAAIAYRPGCVTTTWTGFGRRQAALGYGAGRPLTPKWRSPVPRIAVAVDTSGSMGSGEGTPLHQAACEVAGILKATNSEVQFVACDARVHSAKSVKTWQEAVKEFKGGGGTDFNPVFAHFEDNKGKVMPPEVLIFLTDGYGPAPERAPRGIHTIWVLIGGNTTPPVPWGDVIVVDNDK